LRDLNQKKLNCVCELADVHFGLCAICQCRLRLITYILVWVNLRRRAVMSFISVIKKCDRTLLTKLRKIPVIQSSRTESRLDASRDTFLKSLGSVSKTKVSTTSLLTTIGAHRSRLFRCGFDHGGRPPVSRYLRHRCR
jgi:hypothetical protein